MGACRITLLHAAQCQGIICWVLKDMLAGQGSPRTRVWEASCTRNRTSIGKFSIIYTIGMSKYRIIIYSTNVMIRALIDFIKMLFECVASQ